MTNIGSLLGDAAALMITGMAVVFMFLTILVYLVRLMSKLVPAEAQQHIQVPTTIKSKPGPSNQISPQIVAAISAAVHQHRNATTNN